MNIHMPSLYWQSIEGGGEIGGAIGVIGWAVEMKKIEEEEESMCVLATFLSLFIVHYSIVCTAEMPRLLVCRASTYLAPII